MKKTNNMSSGDLNFKIPSSEDQSTALEYRPLTPSQYLEFIEIGMKLLPDLNAARERSFTHSPTVRFRLY